MGYGVLIGFSKIPFVKTTATNVPIQNIFEHGEVIGFLPYALLSRANPSYDAYITTLAYFSLTIDADGSILKLANPTEEDPGWNALTSGRADAFLDKAKEEKKRLSLVVFLGNNETINELLSDPAAHAKNLTADVIPIMKRYEFTDLNVDIESTTDASLEEQQQFIVFIKTVKAELAKEKFSLTVDITTIDALGGHLIAPKAIAPYADTIVIMAYDYHSTASSVTGPIAPLSGAGVESEYDVTEALRKTLAAISHKKIVLGIPLYGYEWETLTKSPRAAVIPGSGAVLSNKRAEAFLAHCQNCKTAIDEVAGEPYIYYKDDETNVYHQLFYPDINSTKAKIDLAKKYSLGGIALWALGYEGSDIIVPLSGYRK